MAVPKYLGIETEYGIVVRGIDVGDLQWLMSSAMINRFGSRLRERGIGVVGLDGASNLPEGLPVGLANLRLTNGARFYNDHRHPEYSAPEAANAFDATLRDAAGELILVEAMENINRELASEGISVEIYKNNTMGGGTSYGCHENYLIDRSAGATVRHLVPAHFISRQIFTGAGKVGADDLVTPGLLEVYSHDSSVAFQLSQRPDFFRELYGFETTHDRPLVNLRDEPHADASRYMRLHVIVGDANRSQVATFLKLGTTALFLAMAEDGWLDGIEDQLLLRDPVHEFRAVSRDLTLAAPILLQSGGATTALAMQELLLQRAREYADVVGLEAVGGERVGGMILERWGEVLAQLRLDPMGLTGILDWPTKKEIVDHRTQARGLALDSPKRMVVDYQYARLGHPNIFDMRLDVERLFDESTVRQATSEPPGDTRAFFRGMVVSTMAQDVAYMDWDSLVVETRSTETLKRIDLPELCNGIGDRRWRAFFARRPPPTGADLVEEIGRRRDAFMGEITQTPEPERGIA